MKKALLAMHAAVLLWGFTGVLGRAISLDFPVLVWYRMWMTALIIAVIIFYRKAWRPVERKDKWTLIGVGILMAVHWVAFYGAIKFSNASVALVCLATASIFTSILDPLINRTKWYPSELLIGALTLGGVFIIYFFDAHPVANTGAHGITSTGLVLGVIAAILSAVFTVLNKRIASKYPARLMVFWEMSTGWVFISLAIVVALAMGWERWLLNPAHLRPEGAQHLQWIPQGWDWLWMLILALCCTVWAQSLALTALKKLSAFTSTLSVNLEPVYGILLAFLFFQENEELGKGFYIGVGIILSSVALQMFRMVQPKFSGGLIKEKAGID
ncbi:MAG: EamA family transporter [Bacteroidetes bacterium]|nr:EamA family transporter [Bacteroidota bacterium]